MTELFEIREALADAFSQLPGLDPGDKLRTYARIPDGMDPPCAVVLGPDVDYEITMGDAGPDLYAMRVVLYVGSPDADGAQALLDRYLAPRGPYSLHAAIEADPTLGGVVMHARVTGTTNYGIYQMSGARLLGCEFTIPVYASGAD